MPTPKGLAAMLEDLQKAQKVWPRVPRGCVHAPSGSLVVSPAPNLWCVQADDNKKLCQMLEMFLSSSEVTMDFVVNSGGKVVKALRGSKDEDVRKKAVQLTAQWKALVAGALSTASEKKAEKAKYAIKDEDMEDDDENMAADKASTSRTSLDVQAPWFDRSWPESRGTARKRDMHADPENLRPT